jgi:hypothetical protein
MPDAPELIQPNHWAKFIGGPVDGQMMALDRIYPEFGFVARAADGTRYNWNYKLTAHGPPPIYEFVGAAPLPTA